MVAAGSGFRAEVRAKKRMAQFLSRSVDLHNQARQLSLGIEEPGLLSGSVGICI
jgi:hypothetical protein